MSKYKLLDLRLTELAKENNSKLYSPEGNILTVVSNGWINGNLLYDHKMKKVYGLCLKEVIPEDSEYITQCEGQWAKKQIPYNMSYKEAIDFMVSKGKL